MKRDEPWQRIAVYVPGGQIFIRFDQRADWFAFYAAINQRITGLFTLKGQDNSTILVRPSDVSAISMDAR